MLLKCGVLLLAVAVLPFQIPLETVYTSTEVVMLLISSHIFKLRLV